MLVLALFASVGSTPARAAEVSDRLRALAPILGTWATEDVYRPGSPNPIVERGVRRCAYAMVDTYVECVTDATNAAGRRREYRFLIRWDEERAAYTMLSIWSNVGGFQFTTFTLDQSGKTWDIRGTTPYVEDGVERRSWSTLTFENADSALWVGRLNLSTSLPTDWPVIFRETWRRRP